MRIIILPIFCWGNWYNEKQVEKRCIKPEISPAVPQGHTWFGRKQTTYLNEALNLFLIKPFHHLIKVLHYCDWGNYEVPLPQQYIKGYITIIPVSEYSATATILSCPGSVLTSHLER